MSRVKISSFSRAHEYERGCEPKELPVSSCPLWLELFAANQAKKEPKTAVEVARNRTTPSIYDQMNAIIGGKVNSPKFSSVEDVVADYQNRTGLTEYLKQVKSRNVADAAKEVLAAAEKKTLKMSLMEKFPK